MVSEDVTNFITLFDGTLNTRYGRFSDFTDEQLQETDAASIKKWNPNSDYDLFLLADIYLTMPHLKPHMSKLQIEKVEGLLRCEGIRSKDDYEINIDKLVEKLRHLSSYQIVPSSDLPINTLFEDSYGMVHLDPDSSLEKSGYGF